MYIDSDMQEKNFTSLMPLVCVFLALNTTAPAHTNVETNVVSETVSTNAISSPPAQQPKNAVDALHHTICSNIVAVVRSFDRFFEDPSLKEENNDTRISVGLGISWSRENHASLANEVSARVALPNLQNRLQIIEDNMLEPEDPENFGNIPAATGESRPDTGLRYIFSNNNLIRLSADAGMHLGNPSEVFGKLRGRYTVPFGCWEERLTQTLQWYSLDGFAELSTMRWSLMLENNWLFQSESQVEWDEMLNGITPSQVFSLSKQLDQTQGYRWIISGIWPETPSSRSAVYTIENSYRRLIYSNWLFIEFRPGLEFPQAYKFEPNPKFTFLFDCVFAAGD